LSRESLVFGVAGVFFGILVGWIIGSQQGTAPRVAAPAAQQAAAPSADTGGQAATPLDESRAASLKSTASANPKDAVTRIMLGDMYFDAARYPEAVQWYEDALSVDPKNVNASTDLGITYYYTNQTDRALAQFEKSLAIDPNHSKTLYNVGIVRAFGKQDLDGAVKAWEHLIQVAPGSPEANAAKQALDGLKAHETMGVQGAKPTGRSE
jgi:cytochrome c-type biogenesis protein CcmH/NrfG